MDVRFNGGAQREAPSDDAPEPSDSDDAHAERATEPRGPQKRALTTREFSYLWSHVRTVENFWEGLREIEPGGLTRFSDLAKAQIEAASKDREIAANERIRMAELAAQEEVAQMQAQLQQQQGQAQQTQGWMQLGMGLLGNMLQPRPQAAAPQADLAQLQQLIQEQQAQIQALQQQQQAQPAK